MREILFRAKLLFNRKWVYGSFVREFDGYPQIISDEDGGIYEVVLETVGQYTGLLDKNGRKIFEGDIFKFPDEVWESCYTSCGTEYNSWEVENYGVVGFAGYSAKYDFVKYKYNENSVEADLHENYDIEFADFISELEVIGNIYDNPELIGK